MRYLAILLFILIIHSCSNKEEYDFIIYDVNVIDVMDDTLLENHSIFIKDEIIDKIVPSVSNHQKHATTTINGQNLFALPGLIESHFHLHPYYDSTMQRFDAAMKLFLLNGVTGIREAAGQKFPEELIRIRDSLNKGLKLGPNLSVSGITVAQNRQKLQVDDNMQLINRYKELGFDAIKLKYNNLQESLELIKLAKDRNMPIYGHTANLWVNQTGNILGDFTTELVGQGINGIVHLSGYPQIGESEIPEPPVSDGPLNEMPSNWEDWWIYADMLWNFVDEKAEDLLIKKMVENDVWLEPTLFIEHFMYFFKDYERKADSKFFLLGKADEMGLGFPVLPESEVESFKQVFENKQKFVRKFHENGGTVLVGTDGLLCGYDLHTEMEMLVDAGLSEIDVIKAATYDNSRISGFQNTGQISAGMNADLVLLGSNPLDDIRNTRKIHSVFKSGKYIDDSSILEMKKEVLNFIDQSK